MNRYTPGISLFAAGILVFAVPVSKAEAQVTAILTGDNHYGLFHATADGDGWTFIGRNELGTEGNPGAYNWSLPETYTFDAPADHHLYVVAWDEDGAGLSMWVGSFTMPDGRRVVSDTTAWECLCGSGPSPRNGEVPDDALLLADVTFLPFVPPLWEVPNGTEPWASIVGGLIPEVGEDARFIWSEDSTSENACGDHYVIFRSVDPVGSGSAGFIRGDADGDRAVGLTDAINLIAVLFLGAPRLPCEDAADFDDSGSLDLSDAIGAIYYLFLGGIAPPFPGPQDCGPDRTDDPLTCNTSCR
jgi:hypothetical protein